jgi:thiamine biosynthesis lipoprotein
MKPQLTLLLVIIFAFNGCKEVPSKYIYNKGFAYGTMYSIVYQSPDGKDYQEEITKKFQEYTMIFSPYEAESTISKVNRNEDVVLEPEFITCFEKAMEVSEITNGAFDITAGSLINAWGFGPDERREMTPEIVGNLKLVTDYRKIQIQNKNIRKEVPEMKLDMNAISKGFTSDLFADFLKEKGCENYMVEIGGEVVAKGKNAKGKTWTIGISKPDEDILVSNSDLQAKLQLPDMAMATSGNYRNFYVEDGKKYAHTIDPKSGYPVQHSLLSATVLANDCMTADAFATAFMVLGMELGIEIVRQVPGIEVYFIYADDKGNNQVYMSDNFAQYLVN